MAVARLISSQELFATRIIVCDRCVVDYKETILPRGLIPRCNKLDFEADRHRTCMWLQHGAFQPHLDLIVLFNLQQRTLRVGIFSCLFLQSHKSIPSTLQEYELETQQ